MNRVEQYYEVACEYLSLSVSARFFIAAHFNFTNDGTLAYSDADKMDRDVFVGIAKKQVLPEFKRFVKLYKESRDHDNTEC